jgi:SH3 domain-containing YSC84-like protein 1
MIRPALNAVFATALTAIAVFMGSAALAPAAHAQTEQQTLVDRATLVVQEMLSDSNGSDARRLLRNAKGAMICPRLFKAGFILGGQGGNCVLIGRAQGAGVWSSPAFYGMGTGSVGLQIGIQDAEIIFIVLTDKGLQALLDSQFKIGADASVAVATLGAGISGSTTAALRADIVAYAQTRGLFAGVSIDGSLISSRSEWNQIYYGRPMAAQQIVVGMDGQNPGAEPLKEMLARYASAQ